MSNHDICDLGSEAGRGKRYENTKKDYNCDMHNNFITKHHTCNTKF